MPPTTAVNRLRSAKVSADAACVEAGRGRHAAVSLLTSLVPLNRAATLHAMNLRRSWTHRLARLAGRSTNEDEQPQVSDPARDSETEADAVQPTLADYLAAPLLAAWSDLIPAVQKEGRDFATPHQLAGVAEVQARLEQAQGHTPDPETLRMLGDLLCDLGKARVTWFETRIHGLTEGSRSFRRSSHELELKLAHLTDEIHRSRALIDQECTRRGISLTPTADDTHLHDWLEQLFNKISDAGSRRMMAVNSDPLIAEIDKLIDNPNSSALQGVPQWMKRPLSRILELVGERNRYKRLLQHNGMLPP